jgi:hypothetical protein
MNKLSCLIFSGLATLLANGAQAGVGWPNSPSLMVGNGYQANLNALPAQASLSEAHKPWTDTWWPSYQGGIATRWNWNPGNALMQAKTAAQLDTLRRSTSVNGMWSLFKFHLYSREELMAMTPELRERVVRALSPAEKLDLYNGNYSYPTVQAEWKRVNPFDAWWEGICNGWAPASLAYMEPAPREDLYNRDGIHVPFGSSDVKALLSYNATPAGGPRMTSNLGNPCKTAFFAARGNCDANDVNPGAFYIVLANQIGLMHEGFVLDKDPTTEIWNQPVFGYRAKFGPRMAVTRTHNASSAVYEVATHLEVDWGEDDVPMWDAVTGTPGYKFETASIDMVLELDGKGNIVGGRWGTYSYGKDEDYHSFVGKGPDYLWKMRRYGFEGRLSSVNQIYKPAQSE